MTLDSSDIKNHKRIIQVCLDQRWHKRGVNGNQDTAAQRKCANEMLKKEWEFTRKKRGACFFLTPLPRRTVRSLGWSEPKWRMERWGTLAKTQERVHSRVHSTFTNTHQEQKPFALLIPMSRTKCKWLFWLSSCDFHLEVICKWGTVSLTNGRVSTGGWQVSWAFAYFRKAGDSLLLNYAAE